MKVKNINGTSEHTCKCGSWLAHWKKFSGQTVTMCVETSCIKTDLVGAHVQKDSVVDSKWYIIPLCSTHNAKKGESITIADSTKLVSANVSETCGR